MFLLFLLLKNPFKGQKAAPRSSTAVQHRSKHSAELPYSVLSMCSEALLVNRSRYETDKLFLIKRQHITRVFLFLTGAKTTMKLSSSSGSCFPPTCTEVSWILNLIFSGFLGQIHVIVYSWYKKTTFKCFPPNFDPELGSLFGVFPLGPLWWL